MNLKLEVIYLVKCSVLMAAKSLNIESSEVVERKYYYFAGENIKLSLPRVQQEFAIKTGRSGEGEYEVVC